MILLASWLVQFLVREDRSHNHRPDGPGQCLYTSPRPWYVGSTCNKVSRSCHLLFRVYTLSNGEYRAMKGGAPFVFAGVMLWSVEQAVLDTSSLMYLLNIHDSLPHSGLHGLEVFREHVWDSRPHGSLHILIQRHGVLLDGVDLDKVFKFLRYFWIAVQERLLRMSSSICIPGDRQRDKCPLRHRARLRGGRLWRLTSHVRQ